MAETHSDRPVNEDGTTNWQVVFDDLDKGILAAVQAVSSVAQLQALMETIAKLLYKRRHDADTRQAFLDEINAIIRDREGDLENSRADILARLCDERDERIRKAAQYAQNKAISQSLERRRRGTSPGLLERPTTKILAAMLILVLVAGGAFTILDMEDGPDVFAEKAPQKAEPNPAPAPVAKEPARTKPSDTPPPPVIKMLAMKPMPMTVVISGKERYQAYIPLIEFEEGADISALCALSPWIIEAVTLQVHSLKASGREATPATMQSVANAVRRDVNKRAKPELPPLQLLNTKSLPRPVVSASYAGCAQVEIEQKP